MAAGTGTPPVAGAFGKRRGQRRCALVGACAEETEASAVALLAIRAVGGTRSTGNLPGGLRGALGLGPSLKVLS